MNRYKELYRELIEPFQEKLCQHVLTTCPIIVGEDYTKGTFRLLYTGRAVNGWEYNWKEDTLDGLVNQAFSQDFQLKDVENNPVQKDYNFNTSPFWQLCHQIMILKEEADAWSNKVAWSNLYKVAPYSGKNPNNRDIKTQLKVCIDLFKEEINMYKPTHIVLVTDIWWVEPFDNLPSFARELLMLNLIFQLLRNFGIMNSGEAENPVSLTARTLLFLFLALFADEILNIVLKIGGTPFGWMMSEELPPIDFADFNSVLLTILGVSLNGSIALIALILLVMLAWNYLKLLFEAAERYVLLGVLVYTAPMAFSMGGSMNTINIFRSWCRMLGGQIFMILMNVWCLRIFTSMFANFISNPLSLENGNFLIWFLCAIGFLKISQKIDNFMQMLGINVGRTGSSMLGEAAIAMRGLGMTGKANRRRTFFW